MLRLTRVLAALPAAFVLVSTTGAPAGARAADDDVSVQVYLSPNSLITKTKGPRFKIQLDVETAAGARQTVTVTVTLPPGLQWGSDEPDPTELCVSGNPATCTAPLEVGPSGTIGLGWRWDVVADQPGIYELTASVEPTEADPDRSNNTDRFSFEVLPSDEGGGGGAAAVSASAASVKPAKPKAGGAVTASVRVTAGGTPVRPTQVTCAAKLGAAAVKGAAKAARGSASCVYRTPKAAKGKTLRGTVSFRAQSRSFARRFAVKLG